MLVLNQGAWTLLKNVPDFTLVPDEVIRQLTVLIRNLTKIYSRTKLWLKSTIPVLESINPSFYIREQIIFVQIKEAELFNPRHVIQLLIDEVNEGKHDAWVPIANRTFAVYYDYVHLHPYGNRAVNEVFLLQAFGKTCPQMFSRGHGPWKQDSSDVATEMVLY